MPKIIKRILILSCLIAVLILPYFVFADKPLDKLEKVGVGEGPYQTTQPTDNEHELARIIGIVIEAVLSLLGVVFLILIIFAGYNWMTAAGEEEKVKKATDTLTHAIIGLIIVISAYAIYAFIFNKLLIR